MELHQLIDAFNQMCDILKIEETVGEKSNPVFEIEKLPASASKQDLWQALEKVDEILDTVDDALGEGYLDSVMSQSYMRIKCNRSIIPRTGKEKSLENGARKV